MGKYSVGFDGFATPTGTPDTALALSGNAAGEKGEIVELCMTGGGGSAPADTQHRAEAKACTFATAGTAGSSPTPEPFDKYSNAAKSLASIKFTAEPTVIGSAFGLIFGFNQRGGMRWAVPQGEGLKYDNAPSDKGIVFTVVSHQAGVVDGYGHFWEP